MNQLFILVMTMIFVALMIAAHVYEENHEQQMQQHIQLQHAKQQQRIHMSQDLHDTLGSSLVRSITMMSSNTHPINQQHVLSMLKLLRDDLRQVLDSNTYIDQTSIPETPIHWGAPIRHRFSQIFEELNIHVIWDFDATWQTTPSALDCVSLRRVTEEALTNVIKHSHATLVSVKLHYTAKNRLVLDIYDNGVGFEATNIPHHHINIGLRSMQQRVAQISAQLDVHSNHLGTRIFVQKLYA